MAWVCDFPKALSVPSVTGSRLAFCWPTNSLGVPDSSWPMKPPLDDGDGSHRMRMFRRGLPLRGVSGTGNKEEPIPFHSKGLVRQEISGPPHAQGLLQSLSKSWLRWLHRRSQGKIVFPRLLAPTWSSTRGRARYPDDCWRLQSHIVSAGIQAHPAPGRARLRVKEKRLFGLPPSRHRQPAEPLETTRRFSGLAPSGLAKSLCP